MYQYATLEATYEVRIVDYEDYLQVNYGLGRTRLDLPEYQQPVAATGRYLPMHINPWMAYASKVTWAIVL